MAETQTHTANIDTMPPQPAPEVAPAVGEVLSEAVMENWRTTLTETGAYLKDSGKYNDMVLKAKTNRDQSELLRLQSDFVNTVELPILEFARAYVASTEYPKVNDIARMTLELVPDITKRGKRLLMSAISRANAIIRIENYCHNHAIDVAIPANPSEIAQGTDMVVSGVPIYIMRQDKKPLHPIATAASINVPLVAHRGTLHDPVSDGYMADLFNRMAVARRKKVEPSPQPTNKETAPSHSMSKQSPEQASTEENTVNKNLRIAPILASKAVGLSLDENEPPYAYRRDMLTTTPEALVTQIIDDALDNEEVIDFYKVDSAEFGRRVADSIMKHHDSDLVVALKRYTAQMYGDVRIQNEKNGLAKELVAAAESKLNQASLRDALTYLYEFGHKTEATQSNRLAGVLNQINGRRVEVSTQHLLSMMGYHVQEPSRQQDDMGIDIFIDGVPFDVKSTASNAQTTADKEVVRSQKSAYYPSVRFVPPFTRESFEGQIIVPDHVIAQLAQDESLRTQIDTAIANYRTQFGSRLNLEEASRRVNTTYRPTHLDRT